MPTSTRRLRAARHRGAGLAARLAAAAALLALLAAGCVQDADVVDVPPADPSPTELPFWVERVYPEPGAEVTVTASVQVTHEALGPDESVRLIIDGEDVTALARRELVRITYDPSGEADLTELRPGMHEATVELVRLPEPGAQHEVIDTFSWEFEVL